MDLINDLRELALASRLKRLSDLLMRDVAAIYEDLDVDFMPRWFPVFQALGDGSARGVTETAQMLGLTHPAVNQVVTDLVKHGHVERRRDPADERRILLSLTDKGRETHRVLTPVWEEIRRCSADLLADAGCDLLGDLAAVERAFGQRSMGDRVRERLDMPRDRAVRIADYRPAYKKHFASLNREWLEEHFSVEDHDRRLLDDPNRMVLRKGGAILFALHRDDVVGTCALLSRGAGVFELTKMAVTSSHRGMGIGRQLAEAVLEKARELGARTVVLATSPELKAALNLYTTLGFRQVESGPADWEEYERCSISMQLDLVQGVGAVAPD